MTPRTSLEKELNERRVHLLLTWREVASRAGISLATLRQLRLDEPVSELTEAHVEFALHWEVGSIAAVRNGFQPTESGPSQPAVDMVTVPIDDVMTVLRGPLEDSEAYMTAVKRLQLACLVEIVEEDDE